jgi:hexulose-6-phosphate isomerase
MKTGVSFYTFGQDVNIAEACRQSKAAGYDGVELVLSEQGQLNMKTPDADMLRMRHMIEDMGLEVCSVGAWNIWEHNLAGDNPADVQYAKDIVRKQIDAAAVFGADTVLIVPGWVGTNFAPGIVRYDRAYENAQRALTDLVPYAVSAKVCMGIENVWNKFLLSPLEFRRFLEEIDSPYIGAYFDVGNIIYIGYPVNGLICWVNILKSCIFAIAVRAGGLGMFVDLFEGDVDFEALMAAVRRIVMMIGLRSSFCRTTGGFHISLLSRKALVGTHTQYKVNT